ncbi:MAG TPA: TonB-dependent receptor, partial [Gemmatimonadales bacterium]|nr:TonB-dependent receptor [Gemmatimonadales bacterium]
MIRSLLFAGALLVAGGRLAAQVDTGPPRPSAKADSARADSARAAADSAARDTMERYLPTFAPAIPPGPLPRGTRWRFDGDSLVLSDITTLSDLLARIPGVYVARGGWFGAAEVPVYGGQGPLALEVYWDGVPYLPLGRDSVWLDPARIPLGPVERIDVQLLPSTLRVYLVTARQRSTQPRTVVRISTGGNSIAQYRGGFAKRWPSGLGLSINADYRNIDGIEGTSTTAFNTVDLWLKAEYVPSPRYGLGYQILSSSWRRDDGPQVTGWHQRRQDGVLRAFYATRTDGLGERVGLSVMRTQITQDTLVPD